MPMRIPKDYASLGWSSIAPERDPTLPEAEKYLSWLRREVRLCLEYVAALNEGIDNGTTAQERPPVRQQVNEAKNREEAAPRRKEVPGGEVVEEKKEEAKEGRKDSAGKKTVPMRPKANVAR